MAKRNRFLSKAFDVITARKEREVNKPEYQKCVGCGHTVIMLRTGSGLELRNGNGLGRHSHLAV